MTTRLRDLALGQKLNKGLTLPHSCNRVTGIFPGQDRAKSFIEHNFRIQHSRAQNQGANAPFWIFA
ncbi:hypothetical protein J4729_10445 [Leisingera sp. HS039]|uniref:hypothetical protein n=1 Tax=Leisingera sp. HS039 TaxID=2818496 RepID=UPI001B3A2DC5|nr:hypothetical protein [Leisingera sp. HS039]MBQ4824961.1 hypothetical protein [Leisingera sp. HS039]